MGCLASFFFSAATSAQRFLWDGFLSSHERTWWNGGFPSSLATIWTMIFLVVRGFLLLGRIKNQRLDLHIHHSPRENMIFSSPRVSLCVVLSMVARGVSNLIVVKILTSSARLCYLLLHLSSIATVVVHLFDLGISFLFSPLELEFGLLISRPLLPSECITTGASSLHTDWYHSHVCAFFLWLRSCFPVKHSRADVVDRTRTVSYHPQHRK